MTINHECLMVCRRPTGDAVPPTRIVVLKRNPANADKVAELVRALRGDGDLSSWGNEHECDAKRIAAGDWAPIQWYDGDMAEAAYTLDRNPRLLRLGDRYEVGPAGQRIRDAFAKCQRGETGAVPIYESKSANVRFSISGDPDGLANRRWEGRRRSITEWSLVSVNIGRLVEQRAPARIAFILSSLALRTRRRPGLDDSLRASRAATRNGLRRPQVLPGWPRFRLLGQESGAFDAIIR